VDPDEPLLGGGIALVCTRGSISSNEIRVESIDPRPSAAQTM